MVYEYATWVSSKFRRKVYEAYDTLQTEGIAVAEHAAEDVLNNPMAYLEKVFEQAKVLQAQKEQLEKQNVQLTGERDVAVGTIAKVERTVSQVARRIPNVNLNAVSRDLFRLGYFYKQNGEAIPASKLAQVSTKQPS